MTDGYISVDKRRKQDDAAWLTPPTAIQEMSNAPEPKTLAQLIEECYIEPTPGRLIIAEDEFVYHGRVIIPDKNKRRGTTGVILKINGEADTDSHEHRRSSDSGDTFATHRRGEASGLSYKVGDRILYGRYSGTPIEFEGEKAWLILVHQEVLGLVTNKTAKVIDQGI